MGQNREEPPLTGLSATHRVSAHQKAPSTSRKDGCDGVTAASRVTVVVAPDSFKGSLPARRGGGGGRGRAARRRQATRHPDRRPAPAGRRRWRGHRRRRAGGGLGTPRAHRHAARPALRSAPTFALSPDGVAPRTAVVELATASGLALLPGGRPDPRRASTCGTGELVAAALDERVQRVVLGIGGSATTDGGTGLAAALGARFLDADDATAPAGRRGPDRPGPRRRPPAGPAAARRRDRGGLRRRQPADRAARRGPRLRRRRRVRRPEDVAVLDAGLARLAEVLRRDLGVDVDGGSPVQARPAGSAPGPSRSSAPG